MAHLGGAHARPQAAGEGASRGPTAAPVIPKERLPRRTFLSGRQMEPGESGVSLPNTHVGETSVLHSCPSKRLRSSKIAILNRESHNGPASPRVRALKSREQPAKTPSVPLRQARTRRFLCTEWICLAPPTHRVRTDRPAGPVRSGVLAVFSTAIPTKSMELPMWVADRAWHKKTISWQISRIGLPHRRKVQSRQSHDIIRGMQTKKIES